MGVARVLGSFRVPGIRGRDCLPALGCLLVLSCLAVLALTRVPLVWEPLPLSEVGARCAWQSRPAPTVIVLPGYFLPPEFLEDPCREFFRRGFSVAQVDLKAVPRPERAVAELVERLAHDPRAGPLALYAHSGAVTPGVQVASADRRLQASVLMGFYVGVGKGRSLPANLLLVFGAYDDSVSVSEMLGFLGPPAPRAPGERVGDRMLLLSPWSAHGGEPFDPFIEDSAARWLGEALRHDPGTPGWPQGLRHWAAWGLGAVLGSWLPWGVALGLGGLGLGLGWFGGAGIVAVCLARRAPRLLGVHLVSLLVAGNVSVMGLGPFSGWGLAWLAYLGLYLPCQAAGWLLAWQHRLDPYLGLLVFGSWLAGVRLARRGPWLDSALRRWTDTCRSRWLWGAALVLLLCGPPGLGGVAYLFLVRILA